MCVVEWAAAGRCDVMYVHVVQTVGVATRARAQRRRRSSGRRAPLTWRRAVVTKATTRRRCRGHLDIISSRRGWDRVWRTCTPHLPPAPAAAALPPLITHCVSGAHLHARSSTLVRDGIARQHLYTHVVMHGMMSPDVTTQLPTDSTNQLPPALTSYHQH